MSNTLAIGAVTATLRNLLKRGLDDEASIEVTTLPLEKSKTVNDAATEGGLNLFLYNTQVNAAWRNLEVPRQTQPGETGQPPLALDLYYLITAYEPEEQVANVLAHRLLGRAMLTLHDHPLLGADEIEAALAGSELPHQVERVRITPHPLSTEELSKLWVIFQTEYRMSAAYQVSVVLIDSTRPTKAPLPVLKRGARDDGVSAVTGADPTLTRIVPDVEPPDVQLAATLGDDLIVRGNRLSTENVRARFSSLRLDAPVELSAPLPGGSATEIRFHLPTPAEDPNALSDWAPGFYNVVLVVQRPDLPAWTTNEIPFMLAPSITVKNLSFPAGDFTLELDCMPRLREGQRVLLLFGDRQIPLATVSTPADVSQPTALTFSISAPDPGKYVVRLRVDGVDSIPVVRQGTPPTLKFDPNQTVEIT